MINFLFILLVLLLGFIVAGLIEKALIKIEERNK